MDEAPFVAEGTESTVSLVGDKVVVRRKGVKTLLQRGLALYRDPRTVTRAFDGPSKKVVTAALLENKELAKVITGAVQKPGSAEEAGGVARALADALKHNRQAVVDALKANDTLVKAWLRDHKDLAGIVLKGDVHLFIADVTSVALTTGAEGRRTFVLAADGHQLQVPYDPSHEDEFRTLCHALAGGAAPAAPLPSAPAPPAGTSNETKTCPMCAEEVKAAAVLCRFCGHRFDQS
jgi:hypothetical protein